MTRFTKYNLNTRRGQLEPELDDILAEFPYDNASAQIYVTSTSCPSLCMVPSGFRMLLKYVYCITDSATDSVNLQLFDGAGASQRLLCLNAPVNSAGTPPGYGYFCESNMGAWVQSYIRISTIHGSDYLLRVGGYLVASSG